MPPKVNPIETIKKDMRDIKSECAQIKTDMSVIVQSIENQKKVNALEEEIVKLKDELKQSRIDGEAWRPW